MLKKAFLSVGIVIFTLISLEVFADYVYIKKIEWAESDFLLEGAC